MFLPVQPPLKLLQLRRSAVHRFWILRHLRGADVGVNLARQSPPFPSFGLIRPSTIQLDRSRVRSKSTSFVHDHLTTMYDCLRRQVFYRELIKDPKSVLEDTGVERLIRENSLYDQSCPSGRGRVPLQEVLLTDPCNWSQNRAFAEFKIICPAAPYDFLSEAGSTIRCKSIVLERGDKAQIGCVVLVHNSDGKHWLGRVEEILFALGQGHRVGPAAYDCQRRRAFALSIDYLPYSLHRSNLQSSSASRYICMFSDMCKMHAH